MATEYYVHRKGTFVGNAPSFWAKGGNGYTCYIQGAERFSEEDALKLYKDDPSKWKIYKCDDVDARLHLVYDAQDNKRLGTDEPCGWRFGYASDFITQRNELLEVLEKTAPCIVIASDHFYDLHGADSVLCQEYAKLNVLVANLIAKVKGGAA